MCRSGFYDEGSIKDEVMTIGDSNSKKCKIAIFPDTFAHYRFPVFNNLCSESLTIDVYSSERKKGGAFLIQRKGTGSRFNHKYNREYYVGRLPVYQTEVIRKVLSEDYDVVVMWGAYFYLSHWIACILNILLGRRTKIVMWTHGFTGRESRWKRLVRKYFYRMADGILLYGERSRDRMLLDGFDSTKVFTIYNSLDTKKQISIYDRLIGSFDRQRVLSKILGEGRCLSQDVKIGIYIGRLQKRKKLIDVIAAVDAIRSEGVDFKFIVVGEGEERPILENAIIDRGLREHVFLQGPIYDEENLAKLIMASDVALSPGATGLLVNHALVYGTPIVTHSGLDYHGPEVEAIIDGENGCLFAENDLDDMVVAMKQAVELKRNQSLVRRVVLEKYNLDTQKKVFQEMLAAMSCEKVG